MPRHLCKDREAEALKEGLILERDYLDGHPYCLWFNSPTGSKEIWIMNLSDEFEQAKAELVAIRKEETTNLTR